MEIGKYNPSFNRQMRYFKITNREENHYGFQYKDGLNILKEKFNDDSQQSCCEGGFYFTTLEHIWKFYGYGCWLREVFLPYADPNFKMIEDVKNDKWRANMIILGNKYELCNLDTIKKFNLIPNNCLLRVAKSENKTDIIDWIKEKRQTNDYSIYDTYIPINFWYSLSPNAMAHMIHWGNSKIAVIDDPKKN